MMQWVEENGMWLRRVFTLWTRMEDKKPAEQIRARPGMLLFRAVQTETSQILENKEFNKK